MSSSRLIAWFTFFCLFTASLVAVSLKEDMGAKTFAKAGLEKLTPEELAILESWIAGDYSEEVEMQVLDEYLPKGERAFGYDAVKEKKVVPEPFREPNEIVSRIEGEFNGWRGREIFLLENGQVWRQIDNDRFVIKSIDSPEIRIKKSFLGTYFMSMEGYGSRCKVKRVR